MTNVLKYRGNQGSTDPQLTNRLPSPYLWADCPEDGIKLGTVDGLHLFDDFVNFPLPGTQTTELSLPGNGYKMYAKAAGVWQQDDMPHVASGALVGGQGGIISYLPDTDNDNGAIATVTTPFSLGTTQTNGKLWFEARIATTQITTNRGQIFVGLMANSVGSGASAYTFGDGTPLAGGDTLATATVAVGWNSLEDGLAVLNTSYADGATSWTNIQAAANASPLTQLAANTFIKLGMKFDPSNTAAALRFFVNGIETSTPMTKAALLALTYLDVRGLGPCFACYGDTATTTYYYLDWWKVAQVY